MKVSDPHTHLFDHETSEYVAWLDQVDEMTEDQAKRMLKNVLDSLYGINDAGDETDSEPRHFDLHKEWNDNVHESLSDDLSDLHPPDYCAHMVCQANRLKNDVHGCLAEGTLDNPDEVAHA